MNKVRQRIALAAAVAALGGGLAVAPAAAAPSGALDDVKSWTRSCGTTYGAIVTDEYAATVKGTNGSCAGDAWVRAKWRGTWSNWVHNSSRAQVNVGGDLEASQHKGCADCTVYTLYP
ncbi:hypothetical protein [Streptomyces sp. GbtcB7]|jgi:hypothetical protein|uniref:hypothetical protein n=1 Tax=Streptomyces sp. GbtcB7 TaxID=2824752 RepID=UPI001C310E31|nr:hypothetical protein [Streptomyces sp. GbtcB7]